MALTIDTLPVFFKQRDNLFYPAVNLLLQPHLVKYQLFDNQARVQECMWPNNFPHEENFPATILS
jgi:hypothetical protein